MLDAKSHACIMMGYFEECIAYQLFDLVKQQIIITRNVIFYEKYLGIKLLKYSFGLLYSDPFDIVSDTRSIVPLLGISTNSSASLPKFIGSQCTPNEIIASPNQPSKRHDTNSLFTSVGS